MEDLGSGARRVVVRGGRKEGEDDELEDEDADGHRGGVEDDHGLVDLRRRGRFSQRTRS